MKLEQAMKRIGATITKQQDKPGSSTLLLRIPEQRAAEWIDTMTAFLMAAVDPEVWSTDVSKYFYLDQGAPRYQWRIVVRGDTEKGLNLLGNCAVNAGMAHAPEVASFPLSEGSTTPSTQPTVE